jgi:hypothetical protein
VSMSEEQRDDYVLYHFMLMEYQYAKLVKRNFWENILNRFKGKLPILNS